MTFTKQDYFKAEDRANELISRYGHLISKTHCGLYIPPGWYDLVERIFQLLDTSGFSDICVQQIKEKSGGFRFYYEGGDVDLYVQTAMIESQSFQTCEVCGAEGDPDNAKGEWRRTRCKDHVDTRWPELSEKEHRALERSRSKLKSKFIPERE